MIETVGERCAKVLCRVPLVNLLDHVDNGTNREQVESLFQVFTVTYQLIGKVQRVDSLRPRFEAALEKCHGAMEELKQAVDGGEFSVAELVSTIRFLQRDIKDLTERPNTDPYGREILTSIGISVDAYLGPLNTALENIIKLCQRARDNTGEESRQQLKLPTAECIRHYNELIEGYENLEFLCNEIRLWVSRECKRILNAKETLLNGRGQTIAVNEVPAVISEFADTVKCDRKLFREDRQ